MKKIMFLISFILLLCGFSTLSIMSAAENHRWTFESLNPWNGIQGMAFVMSYFFHTGAFVSYSVALVLSALICWGIYSVLCSVLRLIGKY